MTFHLFGVVLYFVLEMLKPVLDGANDKHTPCAFTYKIKHQKTRRAPAQSLFD